MDDTGRNNRIHWYKAEPGALIYPYKHVFSPRIDNLSDDPTGLYELTGAPCPARKYSTGRNIFGVSGGHVDGDYADFMGRSPRSKYFSGGTSPAHPCVGDGATYALPQGLIIASRERNMIGHLPKEPIEFSSALPAEWMKLGIEFASNVRKAKSPYGIEFAVDARDRNKQARQGIEVAESFRLVGRDSTAQGIQFFARTKKKLHEELPARNMLGLACRTQYGTFDVTRLRAGMEIASDAHLLKSDLRLAQGIEFAAVSRSLTGDPQRLAQGIEFAAVSRSLMGDPQRLAQGIEFAEGVITPEPPPGVGPGDDCNTSGAMVAGALYTATINSGESHWWYALATDADANHIVFNEVSGTTGLKYLWLGADCPSKFFNGLLYPPGTTWYRGTVGELFFVQIMASSTCTYEIGWDHGVLP